MIAALASVFATAGRAQVIERPAAFDSAGRVMAITQPLAERLKLAAPIWTVSGEYREVRLYTVAPTGGFVLVVQRPTGELERSALTDAERELLRAQIDLGMESAGRPSGEVGSDVLSEPAGFAFARDQALHGLFLYGPLAAALTDDATVGSAVYLGVAGASFFYAYSVAKEKNISRAQNDLAQHLATDAAVGASLMSDVLGIDGKPATAIALAAAIGGTIAGVDFGRSMSDAEAHAATAGVTAGAATAIGLLLAANADEKGAEAGIVAGGIVGYGLGLAYPRRASYTVTAGDVNGVWTSGILGWLAGATVLVAGSDEPSQAYVGSVMTVSYVAGLLAGDRAIARPYDLTVSEGRLLQVGAVAGGLLGLVIPVLGESTEASFTLGAMTLGSILGTALTISMMEPRKADAHRTEIRTSSVRRVSRPSGVDFDVQPAGLLGAVTRTPGQHPVLRITF